MSAGSMPMLALVGDHDVSNVDAVKQLKTVVPGLEVVELPCANHATSVRPSAAPMVAFLATDAAADISGQVFVVWGTRVHLMQGYSMVSMLDRGEGRFTPEELVARKDELFAGRESGVPPMGFGM